MAPRRAAKRRRVAKNLDSDDDVEAIHLQDKVASSDNDDDDDDNNNNLNKLSKKTTRSKRAVVISDSDDSHAPARTKSASPSKTQPTRRVTAKAPTQPPVTTNKKKDQASTSKPPVRKLVKGVRPKSHQKNSDDDDLEPEHIIESRLRQRKQTAFQKRLEKYNRKRHRPKDATSSSSSSGSDGDEDESSSGNEHDSLFSEVTEDGNNSGGSDDSDDDESRVGSEDFIIEDGAEGKVELPDEFRQPEDLALSFKKIFQLFVYVAVQPPDQRHNFMQDRMEDKDKYFSAPLRNVRNKLAGMKDSVVASSIWPPTFKGPLEKYPDFEVNPLMITVKGCDACKLSSRISTRIGRLSGMRYDRYGFEDIEDSSSSEDSDSDSSSESSSEEKRKKKRKKKKKKTGKAKKKEKQSSGVRNEFSLGKFCAHRAMVYHQFSHWEYDLFTAILDEVEMLCEARKTSKEMREMLPSPAMPDAVTEWLDSREIVKVQWDKIREMMDQAQNLDAAARKGDMDADW